MGPWTRLAEGSMGGTLAQVEHKRSSRSRALRAESGGNWRSFGGGAGLEQSGEMARRAA